MKRQSYNVGQIAEIYNTQTKHIYEKLEEYGFCYRDEYGDLVMYSELEGLLGYQKESGYIMLYLEPARALFHKCELMLFREYLRGIIDENEDYVPFKVYRLAHIIAIKKANKDNNNINQK